VAVVISLAHVLHAGVRRRPGQGGDEAGQGRSPRASGRFGRFGDAPRALLPT
jgi:hypothetical protein